PGATDIYWPRPVALQGGIFSDNRPVLPEQREKMSWRIIFAVLIVMAGASAWGGLRLGDWLVAHGPVAPPVLVHPELANDVPVLDANGLPYTAQPPQPLV